ncbi:MAG: ATP-binding cassette domain-containing protein [Opitutaceae bacterium]|jgi:urea transport system ATP-binding protein|nr:ATP-binding cassette domain-containing protein [Opitutaceae bacterium]
MIMDDSSQTVLSVEALETDIAGSRILRGVELTVNAGEVVALMGRNGVGKTTTLRSITGGLPISEGTITLAGKPIHRLAADARARMGIGYVPQGRDIFPHLSVSENLQIGLVVHGIKGQAALAALERVYDLFPVLKEMLSRKGGVLSGGQQQQLAIGRALLTNPKLLILDEPTEGIQPSIIDQIGDTLQKLKVNPVPEEEITRASRKEAAEIFEAVKKLREDQALAILLVEQYVDFCREVADRFYAMDRGVITISGAIAELTDEVVETHLQV